MNTTQTFTTSRQQASSAALALSITLGMLFSINLLATQPIAEAPMAAGATPAAQVVSHSASHPKG